MVPVSRCGNEILFPNENVNRYFEFAMYSYFEDNGFNIIDYHTLRNLASMDTTDSDGGCFYYWGMKLYKDENCEELVETDGPIENLL